jgi:hypothetical protein
MVDLARMLLQACVEAEAEGKAPEFDVAVSIISGRIGFLSPVDTMNHAEWLAIIEQCKRCMSEPLQLNPGELN